MERFVRACAGWEKIDQAVEVEGRRYPTPLLFHAFQAAMKELTHAHPLLDHRERTFADHAAAVSFLSSFALHPNSHLLTQVLGVVAGDAAEFRFALNAASQQRTAGAIFFTGVITMTLNRALGLFVVVRRVVRKLLA